MDKETDFFGSVLKTAIGIFLGGLLLWAAMEYRARYAVQQINQALEQSVYQMKASTARQQELQAERRRQEELNRIAAKQQQRDGEVAQANRRLAVEAAERAKEDAWTRFYQPSAQCLKESSVACGNAHIKARREFERLYGTGELR
jgi:hypothetical protein